MSNSKEGPGLGLGTNFSVSVVITFKSSQCALGSTESYVSQKKQANWYRKSSSWCSLFLAKNTQCAVTPLVYAIIILCAAGADPHLRDISPLDADCEKEKNTQ